MIREIELTFEGDHVLMPSGVKNIPFAGITGFFGPCGCGKTRVLNALVRAASQPSEKWVRKGSCAFVRARLLCSNVSYAKLVVDPAFDRENGPMLYGIENPVNCFRSLGSNPAAMPVDMSHLDIQCKYNHNHWLDDPKNFFEINGPVGDLLKEVLDSGREHYFVKPECAKYPVTCPNSLAPFSLVREILSWSVLRPGDTLVLDNAGSLMHPTMTVLYAKLLVLLYKQYGVQIVYASNDPFFTQSMQRYCMYYDVARHAVNYLLSGTRDGIMVSEILLDSRTDLVFRDFNRAYTLLSRDSNEDGLGTPPENWNWAIEVKHDDQEH